MNLADITLRLARHADAPTLAAMSRDLIEAGLGWHYRAERVSQLLSDPETVTVVACERERTAGFAIMNVRDERARIVLLAVFPLHQRRGIARRMIAWLVETAGTAGVVSIHVELRAGNKAAYALYRSMQFDETLRLERYYRGRETAIRMIRLLRPPGLRRRAGIRRHGSGIDDFPMNERNDVIIEAWNTVLFDKFSRFKHLLVTGLAGHSDEALRRHPHPRGARVLDVGCGFGDSTLRIAANVGPDGRATGADCAQNFVDAATREAAQAGIANASFFVADAQVDDLRGPYDRAFARFGTMFFNMPGAAMRNIRRSLVAGGELTMIVWRRREANPWVHAAERVVKEIVPVVAPEDTGEVHCGPGPFSMAGADMVSDMLHSAGYDRITFERFDTDICIGRDIDEAVEFAMALGPAGEIIRLAGDEGARRKDQVAEALRRTLSVYARPDGVWAPSSTWFVTARNPA